jgi:putative transposase
MKLDQRKIHWIIRQKIWKDYLDNGQEPTVGENMGRPRKPFDEREAQIVGEGYRRYRFGARMLEVVVRKVFKIRISAQNSGPIAFMKTANGIANN